MAPGGRGGAVRRIAAGLLVAAGACLGILGLAGCGSSSTQLTLSLAPDGGNTSTRPGQITTWLLTVVNQGPGQATGVTASLDLPTGFTYVATPTIDKDFLGATRVQDQDPVKDSKAPTWGAWALAPPTLQADGTTRKASVTIHVELQAGGAPGDVNLVPRASADATDTDIAGQPVTVRVEPAPDLRVDLSVTPAHISRGQDALYRLTLDNFGTGPAISVGILVDLPPGLDFVKVEQVSGNSSRSQPVDPVPGALEVYSSGWTVPAQGPGGPGNLILVLRTRCTFCTGGTFTASAQVTDAEGSIVSARNTAQIVIAAPTAVPTATPPPPAPPPAPTPAPTPTPSAHP